MKEAHLQLVNAIIDNDIDGVQTLLTQGVSPNATLDEAMVTPLHFAAQSNRLEIASLLLEAGADIHAQSLPDGQTPLDIAYLHGYTQFAQMVLAHLNDNATH